jgi:hypothetical protein
MNNLTATVVIVLLAAAAIGTALVAGLGAEQRGIEARRNAVEYPVVVIGGCEYLQYKTHYKHFGITHKGNCTNEVHKGKATGDH